LWDSLKVSPTRCEPSRDVLKSRHVVAISVTASKVYARQGIRRDVRAVCHLSTDAVAQEDVELGM